MNTPEENRKNGINHSRLAEFDLGQLKAWDVVMLLQDILEADILGQLPKNYLDVCRYYVLDIRLCHTIRRQTH